MMCNGILMWWSFLMITIPNLSEFVPIKVRPTSKLTILQFTFYYFDRPITITIGRKTSQLTFSYY